jgi:hypothetical protein
VNFGLITTAPCANVVPPPDSRCSDPEFALENPDICPAQPYLVIKPGVALTCQLGSVQFRAFKVTSGVEVDVTGQAVFSSSNPDVVVIGVESGNATGLMAGDVTIFATYQGMTAHADFTVLPGTDCCQQEHVAMLVLVDITKSMGLAFSGTYPTRLAFAKAAAARFISEVNSAKDSVGLMTFSDAQQNLLAAPTSDINAVGALVPGIAQTQDLTSFFQILTQAVAELNATTADRRVILIISDGEDTGTTDTTTNDPFQVLTDFKNQGGIVMCLGVRSSSVDDGFYRMSLFSTGGFFVNAYASNEADALNFISGLKGYICAGNCTPAGDVVINEGALNYNAFINWNVLNGHVDLLGNGFLDLLPGNGLYVDLGGSTPPYNGELQSKVPFNLVSGHSYRVTVWLAGNQQSDPNDLVAVVKVLSGAQTLMSQTVSITGMSQGFQTYSFSFTAPADMPAIISIQQQLAPGFISVPDPRWGLLLGEVRFEDTGDRVVLFDDNFDSENPVYVPPACGQSSLYPGLYGSACYGGYGCLSSPPGIQVPDPSPLSDIESGSSPPPHTYTSTRQACVSCPTGSQNVSNTTLVPCMTGATTPSGQAAASSAGITAQPWMAFDCNLNRTTNPVTNWQSAQVGDPNGQWIYYKFAAATLIVDYELFTPDPSLVSTMPTDWVFEGSNDGAGWTTLDSQAGVLWLQGDISKRFSTSNVTTYLYYRLRILKTGNFPGYTEPRVIINETRLYGAALSPVCATATATSTISQADADAKALAQATAAAQALLNCQTVYTSTQQYTAHCPVGTFGADQTRSATATSLLSQHDADVKALAAATAAAQAALDCTQSNNATPITINDSNSPPTAASPYPTVKFVAGGPASITKVTVSITGLSHTWPSDVNMVLRGPDGTTVNLMRNVNPDHLPIVGVNLVFDDAGPALPATGIIVSGTYKPTQMGLEVSLAPPCPAAPYGTTLSVFNGKNANGSWSLWVCDTKSFNSGAISGGWNLTIT